MQLLAVVPCLLFMASCEERAPDLFVAALEHCGGVSPESSLGRWGLTPTIFSHRGDSPVNWWCSWLSFARFPISPCLLTTLLQVGYDNYWVEWMITSLISASDTCADVAQDPIYLWCGSIALLAHGQLVIPVALTRASSCHMDPGLFWALWLFLSWCWTMLVFAYFPSILAASLFQALCLSVPHVSLEGTCLPHHLVECHQQMGWGCLQSCHPGTS